MSAEVSDTSVNSSELPFSYELGEWKIMSGTNLALIRIKDKQAKPPESCI